MFLTSNFPSKNKWNSRGLLEQIWVFLCLIDLFFHSSEWFFLFVYSPVLHFCQMHPPDVLYFSRQYLSDTQWGDAAFLCYVSNCLLEVTEIFFSCLSSVCCFPPENNPRCIRRFLKRAQNPALTPTVLLIRVNPNNPVFGTVPVTFNGIPPTHTLHLTWLFVPTGSKQHFYTLELFGCFGVGNRSLWCSVGIFLNHSCSTFLCSCSGITTGYAISPRALTPANNGNKAAVGCDVVYHVTMYSSVIIMWFEVVFFCIYKLHFTHCILKLTLWISFCFNTSAVNATFNLPAGLAFCN